MVHNYLTNECKKGIQEIILKINKYSLNLFGKAAIDCCLDAVNFFGIVKEIYNLFSSSTQIWAVLLSFFKSSSLCQIFDSYDEIISELHQLHIDFTETGETRLQAIDIWNKMEEFEFMVMLYFFVELLAG